MEKHVLEGDIFIPYYHSDKVEVGDIILREWLETLSISAKKVRITVEVIEEEE
jgi:hypothetical protein